MKYYENNGSLFTSNSSVVDKHFIEITQEEYELKLSKIEVKKDATLTEDEWDICIDMATEQDYQNALAELGVEFND